MSLCCRATSGFAVGFVITITTAVKTKQDLAERLRRLRDDLRRLGVQRLGLFGSFQRDDPHLESDVDLLL
ncbi:nucleotidyltransferase domain-containing protein [Salisaeta longa]|uniref:nucleotidyltransferase domain-containing protein n=1 Tax=Salisaeta longa TaxID=503170 RepID=UPI00389AFEF4